MAFLTGIASSPTDLLNSLAAALTANGWTVLAQRPESETGLSAGYGVSSELYVQSPAGAYFQFASRDADGLIISSAATGFNPALSRNSQPGHSSLGGNSTSSTSRRMVGWASTDVGVGPYVQYYFFISNQYCHVTVERSVNSFRHFMSGSIRKAGPFTGGEYYTGTRWATGYTYGGGAYSYMNDPTSEINRAPFDNIRATNYEDFSGTNLGDVYSSWPRIRLDVDGSTNRWVSLGGAGNSTASGFIRPSGNHFNAVGFLPVEGANNSNGLVVLSPAFIMAPRPIGGYNIYGEVLDIAPLNISNLEPKQLLTYGTEQWMVFPVVRKGTGTVTEPVSGSYGLACKIVP